MRCIVVALLLLVILAAAGPATGTDSTTRTGSDSTTRTGSDSTPRLVAAYPNPVADGDAGEFVVLSVPPDTDLGGFAIGDDEARVPLPNATGGGRVALSTHPNATRDLIDRPVYGIPGRLRLANGGEQLRLYRGETVLDTLAYRDSPEGSLRVRNGDRAWRPLGATDRTVVTGGPDRVTAFVLPDAPEVAVDHLRGAEDRILLAGYTLTSERVADALVDAADRNVTVRVLVDGNPVGGMTGRQAATLDRLARSDVDVRVLGGEHARYRFYHAKYAVVDDRALVTTENWKPAGVGGNSSRGWGVVTDQSHIVSGLAETFRADAGWRDARAWEHVREGRSFTDDDPRANGSYPTQFEPERLAVERARLLVAPDNAEQGVLATIERANDSLAVEQVSLGSRDHPFVRASLDAARRGVRVRILLAGAWYVREDNERLASWLNDRAEAEDLPLTAKVADPRGRFEKIHAKGMVIDGERVVIGSLNWNNNSVRYNRETVLVLDGQEVGSYYRRVFEADWRGSAWRLPAGVAVVLVGLAALAVLLARRLRFEN